MCHRCFSFVALLALLAASPAAAQTSPWDIVAGAEAAKLAGPWTAVDGMHGGKVLTQDQLAGIKFWAGEGYSVELGPLVPAGKWPTAYLCNVHLSAKRLSFSRNIGLKGITYWGAYEVHGDVLRLSLQLLPWERSTTDPRFGWNWALQPDTVLRFKKAGK